MGVVTLELANKAELGWAQRMVTAGHYLRTPVDTRCSVEVYLVLVEGMAVGCLIFGRPEATRCYPWYGSVEDVTTSRAEVTRWQVLNLARVWLSPAVQAGGAWYEPDLLPGFVDRNGTWRSTLASTAIRMAVQRIGFDYLMRRPPCFLDEPYEIRWLLSYCDTRLHRGVIYAAAGFQRYRINGRGIETWRAPLPALTAAQDEQVRDASRRSPRSQRYRAQRIREHAQLRMV